MSKDYIISRDKAASVLNVSTRTIDRYIKAGKLSYRKVANKVLLSKAEIQELQQEYSVLHEKISTEFLKEENNDTLTNNAPNFNGNNQNLLVRADIEKAIDEKIEKFFLVFKEKDKMLEEKNTIIFALQQRIAELEVKIQNMIALPDYSKEKQEALLEKKKLEERISSLKETVRNEKIKNFILILFSLVFIGIALFLLVKYNIIAQK